MNATATKRALIARVSAPAANAGASNLSSAKYGYDLVCASTQNAVNCRMKQFLAAYPGQEFSTCYVYDEKRKQMVEMPLADIAAKIGGGPFAIPNGAASNPLVQKLYTDCKFRFAFRAKIGTPAGVEPDALPDIVRLDKGNSLVTYQLYCAEFQVLNLENELGDINWSNLSQPATQPWIFQFTANLDFAGLDFDNLPPKVRQKVKDLNPGTAFSAQQLYLDLNTAGLQSAPTIQGLDPSSDAYLFLTKSFLNTYWYLLKQGSQGAILGYSVKPSSFNTSAPSIVPTELTIEVSPYVDAQGDATGQYGLYTLDYLVMSKNAPMPPAVPFAWNWVNQSEQADFDGVMAIRRDIFVDYLARLVNDDLAASGLNIETYVELHHSGETYYWTYGFRPSGNPLAFQVQPVERPAGADGFTSVLTLSFGNTSHDDSEASSHFSSIHGDYNYSLTGDVSIKDDTVRVTLTAVIYVQFNVHQAGIRTSIVDGNALNYTTMTTYQLASTTGDRVKFNPTNANWDRRDQLGYSEVGLVDTSSLLGVISGNSGKLAAIVVNALSIYDTRLDDMVNGSHSWNFPGGTTFTYKQLGFSRHQDLLAHITYADLA